MQNVESKYFFDLVAYTVIIAGFHAIEITPRAQKAGILEFWYNDGK